MPFKYEGKCGQHCGTTIHVNSKLGFLNGLCWIEEVPHRRVNPCGSIPIKPTTPNIEEVFGVVGFMGMLHGIDQFSVTALFFKKALLL